MILILYVAWSCKHKCRESGCLLQIKSDSNQQVRYILDIYVNGTHAQSVHSANGHRLALALSLGVHNITFKLFDVRARARQLQIEPKVQVCAGVAVSDYTINSYSATSYFIPSGFILYS
jgi:hypothetical protein